MTTLNPADLFVFAGETSGDAHGGDILKALQEIRPKLKVEGVAGPAMRATGMDVFLPMEHFQVMGFTAVIKALPRLLRAFRKIKQHILNTKPACVLLIDYPGFNMRMAKALRQAGYQGKIIHYICPTVWAWGKERVNTLASTLDELLVIFPFEPAFFANTPLHVTYTGNPSFDAVTDHIDDPSWAERIGLPSGKDLLAIFPGSRASEVAHNLSFQLQAARKLCAFLPNLVCVISLANEALRGLVQQELDQSGLQEKKQAFLLPKEYNFELMKKSRAAIATSGTITLELALHRTPTVVVYYVSWLNALFAKYYLKLSLPYYCIVNILANRQVFPELMHQDLSVPSLTSSLLTLLEESKEREYCLEGLDAFSKILTSSARGYHAAKIVLRHIEEA